VDLFAPGGILHVLFFFFSSRRRHTRSKRDWSSDVCSSDLTFGLRYDWQSTIEDRNNVAPRFAYAFAPAPKTVLRGGAGIFYDNRSEERRVGKECRFRRLREH